jgi:hypothetical protein
MCLLCTLIVTATVLASINTPSQAAGSYEKRPMFDHLVIGGVPTPKVPFPQLPAPQINPQQFFQGCGRGRVRDPQNHLCNGPANVGH